MEVSEAAEVAAKIRKSIADNLTQKTIQTVKDLGKYIDKVYTKGFTGHCRFETTERRDLDGS